MNEPPVTIATLRRLLAEGLGPHDAIHAIASILSWPEGSPAVGWPDVGAPVATRLMTKSRLQIRQPDMIRPSVGADHNGMGAAVFVCLYFAPQALARL